MSFTKEQIKDLIYLKENNGCIRRECPQCQWRSPTATIACWFQNQEEYNSQTTPRNTLIYVRIKQMATILLRAIIFEEQK